MYTQNNSRPVANPSGSPIFLFFLFFFLLNPVVISQYFVGGRVGRLFVTHSCTIGTHSHSRLVQEIAQERETNEDEEMRVYERQRCHREQGTPRKRAGLGASGEFPFSPNTPFMPRFIPPSGLRDWPQSHSTAQDSPPLHVPPSMIFVVGWKERDVVVS